MGPRSDVRDTTVKTGKEILMSMDVLSCCRNSFTYYSLSFRKLILEISGLLELFVIGRKDFVTSTKWKGYVLTSRKHLETVRCLKSHCPVMSIKVYYYSRFE